MNRGGYSRSSFILPPSSFRLADLVLAQELAETWVSTDRVEVGVLAHVAEIAVAQFDRAPQGLETLIGTLQSRVATGEIVVSQGVVGAQGDQAAVNQEALGVATLERQQLAHLAQY